MDNMDNILRAFGNASCILILILWLISVLVTIYYNQPTSTYALIITTVVNGLLVFIIKVAMKLSGV